ILACFFFQAEDGIRDRNVTGVQTCALPISSRADPSMIPPPPGHRSSAWSILCGSSEFSHFAATSKPKAASRNAIAAEASRYLKRSEERRVGKEWKLRG